MCRSKAPTSRQPRPTFVCSRSSTRRGTAVVPTGFTVAGPRSAVGFEVGRAVARHQRDIGIDEQAVGTGQRRALFPAVVPAVVFFKRTK